MKSKAISGLMLTLLLISTFTSAFNVQQVKALEEGVIAYWKLDEGSGAIAIDSIGENHGAIHGATWTSGKVNGALSFDGVNDYVEVPNVVNGLNAVTIEAWFKYVDSNTWRWIYGGGPSYCDNPGMCIHSGSNVMRYHWRTTSDAFDNQDGTITITTNTWYHIAYVYDGSIIKSYINGVEDFSRSSSGTIVAPLTQAIGAGYWDNNEYFYGLIDEVAIYNRALTPEEIQQHYQKGIGFEHELDAYLEAPDFLEPDDSSLLNATVYNIGWNNETMDLSLLINGTVVDSATIPTLANGTSYTLSYLWAPTVEAVYNVTAYALPVPGENVTANNIAQKMVHVAPEEAWGLIAYYPFNGNANDESGNNHDGTIHGATLAADRFGNPNSAYSFDGISDYVEIPHDVDFDFGTGAFTVSAWIKTNATTTWGSGRDEILSKGDATISGYAISVENNKAAFWVGPSGELFGGSVLNDGEWHQIVGTRNDSGTVVLYVDGMIECTGINNQDVDTAYSVFIGKHGTSSESYFDGLIDDVKIYNRAVPPRGVFLSPSSHAGYGIPGTAVNYTLQVTNKMGSDDSFGLSVLGHAWPTSLSIVNTGTVLDGESLTFSVEVEVPPSASPGDTDTATVTAVSVSDPNMTHTAAVTTTATSGEYAYVAVSPSDYVALVDRVINQVVGTINVGASGGHWPWRIAIEPGGQYAYVSCRDSHNIVVIDRESNSIFTVVSDPALNRPHGIAFTYDGAYALVGSRDASQVVVVDTNTHAVVENIPVSSPPTSIATSPDGAYAYATSRWSSNVYVIDLNSMSMIDTISVGSNPWGVVVSPGGELVYVTNRGSSTVSVIDTSTNLVIQTVTNVGNGPHGLEISPDGSYLYVAGGWSGAVHVIDTSTNMIVANLGIYPGRFDFAWDVAATFEGDFIYVTNSKNQYDADGLQVCCIDTSTNLIIDTISMPDSDGDGYPDWGARGLAICPRAPPYEHELNVRPDAPNSLEPGDFSLLNATVYNRGLSNETEVELFLMINGTVVNDVTIPELVSGTSYTIDYLWTPTVEATYNVTAYVPPVPGENVTVNNRVTRMVNVRYITVALISDHSELLATTPILDSIGIGYDVYNDNNIYLYTEDLDLLLSYKTVILYTDYRHLTSNEYNALESYLSSFGSLLVTGFDSLVSDDLLRDVIRSATMGDNVGEPDLYVVDAAHPIMNGPYGSFPAGYHITGLVSDCDAVEADAARMGVTVAELADGCDKIIATDGLPGKVVFWNGVGHDDWLWNVDCEAMLKNTLAWFMIRYEHELTVSTDAPPFLKPGESSVLNATVYNRGLSNETNLELQLLINGSIFDSVVIPDLLAGSSYTLNSLWTPTIEGIYNVTAYAPPVPGENITINNSNSQDVIVMEYFAFHFRACIDGSDWVYIRGNEVWYVHRNNQYPGIHPDCPDDATYINGDPWYPEWPDDYGYDDYGQRSLNTYTSLYPSLLSILSFTVIEARDSISIVQYPSVENDYTTIILLDDDPTGGAAWYQFELRAIRYQHELAVTLDTPTFLEPGDSSLLNATVLNGGLNNETNVVLSLAINGTVVDSVTIPTLVNGTLYTLSFLWTPPSEAMYNVTVYTLPVLGESITANNIAQNIVHVRPTKGYILFDQTHWTDSATDYTVWVSGLVYRGYIVDTLTISPITPSMLEGYDVFVIPQAHDYYSPDEISAIQDFVLNGGGLLIIGNDEPYVYTELTSFTGITWGWNGYGGDTSDISLHPVTEGVGVAYFDSPMSMLYVTSPAIDLIRDPSGHVMLAASEIGYGKVLGIADEHSINDGYIYYADNFLLANNMIDWLIARYEHDLAAALNVPTFLEPGDSSLLNATVYNRGLSNETEVELFLMINGTVVNNVTIHEIVSGTSYTIDYLWTPTVEAMYNVTAYVPPVPGENITINNSNSRYAIVAREQTMWVESNVIVPVPTYESFTIDIYINVTAARMNPGAAGLYAWEFRLYWENDKLNCTHATDHFPYSDWESPNNFVLGPGIDQAYNTTHGRYWRGIAALPMQSPYPTPFVGVMSICTLHFHVIYDGADPYTAPLSLAKNYGFTANLGDDTGSGFDFIAYDGYVTLIRGLPSVPGDVNADGIVDIRDVLMVAIAFGSRAVDDSTTPWDDTRNWNPDADLNNDGIINILDIVIIGVNFGKTR